MQPMPHIGFPFPLTIGATLAVVWVLSGALIPLLLLHLPTCSAPQEKGKKRRVCFQPASSPYLPHHVHHLHLFGREGQKMPFPGLSVAEAGVGCASILQSVGRKCQQRYSCPSCMRLLSRLVHTFPPALFASSCSFQRKEGWMLRQVVCSSCLLLPLLFSPPPGGWPGRGFPSVFSASETALTTVNQRCS